MTYTHTHTYIKCIFLHTTLVFLPLLIITISDPKFVHVAFDFVALCLYYDFNMFVLLIQTHTSHMAMKPVLRQFQQYR